MTLLSPVTYSQFEITFVNLRVSGTTTLSTATGYIGYGTSSTYALIPGGAITIVSDGANWLIKNYFNYNTLASSYLAPLPAGYRGTANPVYASTATLTVPYINDKDSTALINIYKSTTTTLNMATNGLNGLDTGSVAINTFYYLYSVTNGTTTGIMASTVDESTTGTLSNANYAYTGKRQLQFAFLTDGSGNIIPFYAVPESGYVGFRDNQFSCGTIPGSGENTSYTAITAVNVPSFSTRANLTFDMTGGPGGGALYYRTTGTGATGFLVSSPNSSTKSVSQP